VSGQPFILPAGEGNSTTRLVNCGGHFVRTCGHCPAGYGHSWSWCNGECEWHLNRCMKRGAYVAATTPHLVDCGGHYEDTCEACSAGHGRSWCNGECVWTFNSCMRRGASQQFVHQMEGSFGLSLGGLLPAVLVCWLALLIYAFIYKRKVVSRFPQDITPRDADFDMWRERELGVFAVFKNPQTALWAFFCTPVLAAKNYHVGQVLSFWPACMLMTFTTYSPLCCLMAPIRAMLSTALQRNLRHEPNFTRDVLVNACCLPCEVGRESIEVDDEEFMEVMCPFVAESTWFEPRKDDVFFGAAVAEVIEEEMEHGCIGRTTRCAGSTGTCLVRAGSCCAACGGATCACVDSTCAMVDRKEGYA